MFTLGGIALFGTAASLAIGGAVNGLPAGLGRRHRPGRR